MLIVASVLILCLIDSNVVSVSFMYVHTTHSSVVLIMHAWTQMKILTAGCSYLLSSKHVVNLRKSRVSSYNG